MRPYFTHDFEFLNEYNGRRSSSGTVENDYITAYFMRSLYERAISGTRFLLPDTWNKNYFRNVLYLNGYIAVIKTDKYGIIPQINTLSGYGLYREPTTVLVSQPLVTFEGRIGEDCELIRLTPYYMGIWDIVEHYAIQLSELLTTIHVSVLSSRAPFMAAARNKSAARTLEAIVEKITAGDVAIIYDEDVLPKSGGAMTGDKEPIWTAQTSTREGYIVDRLLADLDTTLKMFDREIGIAALGEKKERRIEVEVEQDAADSAARCETWAEMLQETFDNTNRLFPELNLSFRMKYGGETYEYIRQIDVNRPT